MVFKTKRDLGVTIMYVWGTLVMLGACVFVKVLSEDLMGWVAFFCVLLMALCMVWLMVDIKYTLKKNELAVKSGPIRIHIPYEKIIEVHGPYENMLAVRLLGSTDAMEIVYQKGKKDRKRSVDISPKQKELFLEKLKERNPNIRVKISLPD